MKKIVRMFLLMNILVYPALSQYVLEKTTSFSYGEKPGQVSIRKETDGTYGPNGFLYNDKTLYLLDAENNEVKLISPDGKLLKSIRAPYMAQELSLLNGNICIIDNNDISTVIDPVTSKIIKVEKQSRSIQKPDKKERVYNLVKLNYSTAEFSIASENGKNSVLFMIKENTNRLASISLIGVDNERCFYFNEEVFVTEIPCLINRFILKYNSIGELVLKIKLPDLYYCRLENDLTITPEGDIFHLIANKDNLEIVCWKKTGPGIMQDTTLNYPPEYNGRYHYNEKVNEKLEGSNTLQQIKSSPLSDENKVLVDRNESLQIADTYVQHKWACQPMNLTNGTVTASDGKQVKSPEWIALGTNQKVPYKWGGFSTITQFDQGLVNARYAGDNICTGGGSGAAVGVDCSGFVSRCWKLSSHYSTSMMPSIISPLSLWSELKKGDAVHKVGHVRMSVENNPNGTMNLVESAGKDWRVSYRTYNFNDLSGYTPNRYKNMMEPQTGIKEKNEISKYKLYNNYPNPFNPVTNIGFEFGVSSYINLKILDLLGREVATLVNENKPAGSYSVEWNAAKFPSGIYFYRINVNGDIQTKKMILNK